MDFISSRYERRTFSFFALIRLSEPYISALFGCSQKPCPFYVIRHICATATSEYLQDRSEQGGQCEWSKQILWDSLHMLPLPDFYATFFIHHNQPILGWGCTTPQPRSNQGFVLGFLTPGFWSEYLVCKKSAQNYVLTNRWEPLTGVFDHVLFFLRYWPHITWGSSRTDFREIRFVCL